MSLDEILADLQAEQQVLDGIVSGLDAARWEAPTPSPRWRVADQVAHLCYFDEAAVTAIRDPEAFKIESRLLFDAFGQGDEAVDDLTLGPFRRLSRESGLRRWRQARQALTTAAGDLAGRDRVEWYGPSMGAKSFLTARLMEAWAHGQDVCDAVGARREPTDRLRHVAQLGYITRAWSYANRGLPAPLGDVRVELSAPSGDAWAWGDPAASADDSVTGAALDFCLVVTQRRNLADTSLQVTGERALDWLSIAQAFAGPPTDGPPAATATGV